MPGLIDLHSHVFPYGSAIGIPAPAGIHATPGEDFVPVAGTITFWPGQISVTITVNVVGDVVPEWDEWLGVSLSNASSNATIADSQGAGTITNDDASPSLTINDVAQAEGDPVHHDGVDHFMRPEACLEITRNGAP